MVTFLLESGLSSLADQDGSGYELVHDIYVGYWNSIAGIDWYIMPYLLQLHRF